jgi:hypothetical protein
MRDGRVVRVACSVGLPALAAALAACLSGQAQPPGGPRKGKPIIAKEYGTLRGKVVWKGPKPDLKRLTADLLRQINTKADKGHCLAGPEDQKTQQQYRIGKNGGLGNVLVWVEPENRRDWFVVPEGQLKKVRKRVEVRAPYCAFVPHCLVLFPAHKDQDGKTHRTGQALVARNDTNKTDAKGRGIQHNVKVVGSSKNPQKGETIAPGRELTFDMIEPDDLLNISCDIHPWMRGHARSLSHPWGAVTKVGKGEKDPAYGRYEIKGVPLGVRLRVIAWHEELKYLAGSNGKVVTLAGGGPEAVEPGEAGPVNFEARPK